MTLPDVGMHVRDGSLVIANLDGQAESKSERALLKNCILSSDWVLVSQGSAGPMHCIARSTHAGMH